MEQEPPLPDLAPLLEAAADFASYPGHQNDAAAKDFLDRFPLSVLFGVLQNVADVPDVPGSEETIVSCLDRIFKTKYGASHLPQYMPFVQAGLQANSEIIRCLACKAVSHLLGNQNGAAVEMIVEYHIYPLLINCLLDGNEQTAAVSLDAIKSLGCFPQGISIIFPTSSEESIQLKTVASNCSSLARIRILGLIAQLFSISSSVASTVHNTGLLTLFEAEVNNKNDMLTTLSALELLYELAESPYSSEFLLKTSLLQLLTEMISNSSVDSVLRLRAVLVGGRLLSSSDAYMAIHAAGITSFLLAIDGRLESLKNQNTDETESALETLGQIGTSAQGAAMLLTISPVVARHVLDSAFTGHGRGVQLAALYALGSICGVDRREESMLLNNNAEESLKRLIYETAANNPKLTPSGLLLKVLQQEPEIRLAAYRAISGLVARPWCLVEVCSRQEIITMVTDPSIESTKNNMEARHHCCVAINKALSASTMVTDASVAGIAEKLQEAVKRGPYLAKKRVDAQPIVVTAERF